MARGNDERHNPSRRPMGRDEALNYIMKTFPGSEVVGNDLDMSYEDKYQLDDEEYEDNPSLEERNEARRKAALQPKQPPEMGKADHLDMMYEDRYQLDDNY